ncbi:hypothetical protein NKR23_g7315 [Pleurostoma richardsiae]|uniref:Uncharacterized protein n=1 Tax=Pleurostoma richardsiae TaxID=41990 RepID=A0AA38R8P6_9PEZI|nr:hypothetical protein NKR23_g7315 [Pleurostoma richardsiae]
MSNNSNGSQASDIITYIGVPLAVLGVLPILYNTFATLVSLSRIRRMLRKSRLTALTRSDVVNRVIEIELPRYAVTPLDRFRDRAEYWNLSRHPSSIPGGSWTVFNWRASAVGARTQRVEYADQVRQPQVDVAFDELVCYLLDLGAVPDPHGWRLLRSTGLWTPVGCALMTAPDGREKALTIAPSDDSDGNLSLAVAWSSAWITRDYSHLPPYWVRLPPPPPPEQPEKEKAAESSNAVLSEDELGAGKAAEGADAASGSSSKRKGSVDSLERAGRSQSGKPVTCQISIDGIVAALIENAPTAAAPSALVPESLYIEHLRIRPGRTDGVWFASATTAYGTTSQTILWNYKIPDDILAFARKETVPCGVLVLLGVVDESDTPQWATKYNDSSAQLDMFVRRSNESRMAMEAEARMPPAQREQAVRDRMRRESENRLYDMRDRMRQDNQRRETRLTEALQSPKWDTKLVAEHNLRWLRLKGHVAEEHGLKDVVGFLLHRMVLDGELSASLCRMLDLWKGWADVGGMKRADYDTIMAQQVAFAQATLLVALIKDTSAGLEGSSLAMDLQECLRLWRKVRLG